MHSVSSIILKTFQPDIILFENPQYSSIASFVPTSIFCHFDPKRNVQIFSVYQHASTSIYLKPLFLTTVGTIHIFFIPQS